MVVDLSPVAINYTSDMEPVFSEQFRDIQANIECGFIHKCGRDMTRTYSDMHRTDKYSQLTSIIWSICRNV